MDLYETDTKVTARLTVRRNPDAAAPGGNLMLDGEGMRLLSVAIDGRVLAAEAYAVDEESLTLYHMPDTAVLDIITLCQPQDNTALSGLYKSGGNFCTQCEPEGFRRITYFIDRPDVMSRYTTHITADKGLYPVLLSNGQSG